MPFELGRDHLILVPGFFGFACLGGETLCYFARVREALEKGLELNPGALKEVTTALSPPPVGSLQSRVKCLADQVLRILDGGAAGERRVHLIGHSTGGLAARLLLNRLYAPRVIESEATRERLFAAVASATAISAPMHGSPFAANVPVARPVFATLHLYALLSSLKRLKLLQQSPVVSLGRFVAAQAPPLDDLPQLLAGLPQGLIEDVAVYLAHIGEDSSLLHDLDPAQMVRTNQEIAGGDQHPIRQLMTVSPPPSVHLDHALERGIYAVCYLASSPWRHPRYPMEKLRAMSWIGPAGPDLLTNLGGDGVVPVSYQHLPVLPEPPGLPPRVVLADHLDVIGHVDDVLEVFFKSDAGFDRARFEALWAEVARGL
jgi:pimeloyl-ACP methyl ester carboxylesterase